MPDVCGVPTWDDLAQQFAWTNLSASDLQRNFAGFTTEGAEITLLLGGVPGGVRYDSFQLATYIDDVNRVVDNLNTMLQNGVPLPYVSTIWERAKCLGGRADLPSFTVALGQRGGTLPPQGPAQPPPGSAPAGIPNCNGSYPSQAGQRCYWPHPNGSGAMVTLNGPPNGTASVFPCPPGYAPDAVTGECVAISGGITVPALPPGVSGPVGAPPVGNSGGYPLQPPVLLTQPPPVSTGGSTSTLPVPVATPATFPAADNGGARASLATPQPAAATPSQPNGLNVQTIVGVALAVVLVAVVIRLVRA